MGMTVREQIKTTLSYRLAIESGATFRPVDVCRDLHPAWDSTDGLWRSRRRSDVSRTLNQMAHRGELRRDQRGQYGRPARHSIHMRPLAVVPEEVRREQQVRHLARVLGVAV